MNRKIRELFDCFLFGIANGLGNYLGGWIGSYLTEKIYDNKKKKIGF